MSHSRQKPSTVKAQKFNAKLSVEYTSGEKQVADVLLDEDINLLQQMHDAGLPVRKACRNGGCGVCRCRLSSGQVSYRQREPFALWEQDKADGIILPCIAFAVSDLELDQLSFDRRAKLSK